MASKRVIDPKAPTCQRVVRFPSGKIALCPDPNRGGGYCDNHRQPEPRNEWRRDGVR